MVVVWPPSEPVEFHQALDISYSNPCLKIMEGVLSPPGLGWVNFNLGCSFLGSRCLQERPTSRGILQIQVNPTKVREETRDPVHSVAVDEQDRALGNNLVGHSLRTSVLWEEGVG